MVFSGFNSGMLYASLPLCGYTVHMSLHEQAPNNGGIVFYQILCFQH